MLSYHLSHFYFDLCLTFLTGEGLIIRVMREKQHSNFFKKMMNGFKNPVAIICFSFLLVIFLGSALLSLPIAIQPGVEVAYIDNLFTAVSCTCVTGLSSVTLGPGSTYTYFGRAVMGVLIELGGLGVTTLAVLFYMIFSHKLGFTSQNLIKENWNLRSLKSIRIIFLQVLLVSFSFIAFGTIIMFLDLSFLHNYNYLEAFGYGLFHAVSAFNNAGFDIFENNTTNLVMFNNDLLLNFTTAFLIISGGIGYFVIIECLKKKFKFPKFSLHAKIVLTYSLALIIIGTLLIYLLELGNPNDFAPTQPDGVTIFGAFFMSVSARTAGFTFYDLSLFKEVTLLFITCLMFIGARPGSAGGGIKTTTFALALAYLRGLFTNRHPYLFKRAIPYRLVRRALIIIILGFTFFLLGLLTICFLESDANYLLDGQRYFEYVEGAKRFSLVDYTFEAMSAFGTVGLSTGFTPYYTLGSKIVLIVLMYVGRVGPLSISTTFRKQARETFRFPEEEVPVG